jgi:hypothetical protein
MESQVMVFFQGLAGQAEDLKKQSPLTILSTLLTGIQSL